MQGPIISWIVSKNDEFEMLLKLKWLFGLNLKSFLWDRLKWVESHHLSKQGLNENILTNSHSHQYCRIAHLPIHGTTWSSAPYFYLCLKSSVVPFSESLVLFWSLWKIDLTLTFINKGEFEFLFCWRTNEIHALLLKNMEDLKEETFICYHSAFI